MIKPTDPPKSCHKCGSTERAANNRCACCKRNYDRESARERREKRLAARRDPAEHAYEAQPVPEGYHIRGMSKLVDADGVTRMTWIKSAADSETRVIALMDALEGLKDKLPREPLIPESEYEYATVQDLTDLVAVYPMGDPHLGMYSWAEETGENFDIAIAERQLLQACDMLVALAPPAETALILNLGDFFHSDNSQSRTSRGGNALDTDSRWARVLAVGVRVFARMIDRALEKHQKVVVRCEIGNHDDHTSIALSVALDHHYHLNPRVQISTSPAKFWYYEFGKCLVATTHGDTVKLPQLPAVMAFDQPEAWGRTTFRHWYTGHVHHESVKEYPGCVVETFRTLAPRDAWHASKGYRSGRDMRLDIWHRQYGLMNRHIVGVGQLGA